MKIAIADDNPDFLERAVSAVNSNVVADVISYTQKSLQDLVGRLATLQRDGWEKSELDDLDIVILDYDLRQETGIGLTTGADIARLLRSHTLCGPIILTNPYVGAGRDRRFDLRLVGDLELMSDIEIASEFLSDRGLWHSDDWPMFRPSMWPVMFELAERLDRCTETISKNLDGLLYEAIPELANLAQDLSSDEIQWIGAAPEKTKLRDIAGGGDLSLLAPQGREGEVSHEVEARFIAARLMKWLDQFVRIRGIALIDGPHLVKQQPETVIVNEEQLSNQPFHADRESASLHPAVLDKVNPVSDWCSRRVWRKEDISRDEVATALEEQGRDQIDLVFCEDTTRFQMEASAQSYLLEIPSPYRRRWISDPSHPSVDLSPFVPDYQPAQWLAM